MDGENNIQNNFRCINHVTNFQFEEPSLWHISERFMIPLNRIKEIFQTNLEFNNGFRIYRIDQL